MELNDILTPLIAKGQSINHIFASHADEIGLSEKTIYNYIDMNAFQVRNIDLPKKVRYRQRHPHDVVMKMDTVKGARGSHKVLLTMILRDTNFMLIFLLPDGTQKSVLAVFDKLTMLLGIETFRKIFPVILTDNGVEF